ncbi:hypothetical protein CVT26_001770 [Gymnopilus dilepis]|uniref:Uncharacterized protein n=1 Tax=Gymnopilus dilepis TaxID=231916 RepID=A0A409Y428_9AGAR|nr:hypothetical protein CVT26_001770 [Gymnopilus dilepis]
MLARSEQILPMPPSYVPGAIAYKTDATGRPGGEAGSSRLPKDKVWTFEIYSSVLRVQQSYAHSMRLYSATASLEVQLHDLLSASLTPLTHQYTPNQLRQIASQATVFLSSFHENGKFLRFRFPYITFEWFLQTPYFEIASCTTRQSVEIEILWKAWSTAGAASGLVAYGSIRDTIIQKLYYAQGKNNIFTWVPLFVILDRQFKVTRVFQPELMTPTPYLQHIPINSRPDDAIVIPMSSDVIQFLRSSQARMGFLVAISALFASIQPINRRHTMWARSPVIPDSKGGRWYQPGAVAWKTDVAAIPGVGAPGLPRDKVWTLAFYSSELRLRQSYVYSTRLHGATASLEVQLHDLLSASLTPLTRQYTPNQLRQIGSQATLFLSSFHENAQWSINAKNLPSSIGDILVGQTEKARRPDVGYRFLRFRFPYITFEWFVQTPYAAIAACTAEESVEVEILWKAWSTAGASSGLVAYGSITDTIKRKLYCVPGMNNAPTWVPLLVIIDRQFKVTRVFQPELMTPIPYLRFAPPNPKPDDTIVFSMSSNVIQFLRSSQLRMGFLVSISALFASVQPIVNNFSEIGGWVFTGIGVLSGLLTVFALLLGRILAWSELKAAKARQM